MRTIMASREVVVPKGVSVTFKNRVATVKGPRGSLKKSFRHLTVNIITTKNDRGDVKIKVEMFFANRLQLACIRTMCTHIQNMIKGVTVGYEYKMRMVYSHFPITCLVENGGKHVEIRNFLGLKQPRSVDMFEGVICEKSEDVKDQLIISGNDIELVSQSAANIQQSTRACDFDIRKFLDGVYVESKGHIVKND